MIYPTTPDTYMVSSNRLHDPYMILAEYAKHNMERAHGVATLERFRDDPDYLPAAYDYRDAWLAADRVVGRLNVSAPAGLLWSLEHGALELRVA